MRSTEAPDPRFHEFLGVEQRLTRDALRALAPLKQKLLVQGLEARPGTAAEFGKFVDDETRKWGEVIRAAGLKGE
jgi:hypothetical protein